MIQQTLDFSEQGRALKDAGISRVLSNTPPDYKEKFIQTVLNFPYGHLFTSDDVVAQVGLPPHCNTTGGLINGLSKSKIIVRFREGDSTSKRVSRHGAELKMWRRI